MNKNNINVSLELIEYLKETFPNTLPTSDIGSFELGKLIGIQELIAHIIKLQKP